jgi:hypothetical protein
MAQAGVEVPCFGGGEDLALAVSWFFHHSHGKKLGMKQEKLFRIAYRDPGEAVMYRMVV